MSSIELPHLPRLAELSVRVAFNVHRRYITAAVHMSVPDARTGIRKRLSGKSAHDFDSDD